MTGATARPEPAEPAAPAPSRLSPAEPAAPAPSRLPPAEPAAPAASRLPPEVSRIRVIRDDNDGLRRSADFPDVQAALAAVERHMHRPGVYTIMIIFDS